jgi:uncharacterized membrane protein
MIYTCPMHPEVKQNKPGNCPKCGMRLVNKEDKKAETKKESYQPLLIIIGLILLTAVTIAFKSYQELNFFNLKSFIATFMAGFFIVFAGFKLIDIRGFAEGYHTYDLLAQRVFGYGYIYPFVELFFGLAMILTPSSAVLLWSELLVMSFSGIGVLTKLLKREKFRCVCLGTAFNLPLTNVTLIEDFGMAALALLMLVL